MQKVVFLIPLHSNRLLQHFQLFTQTLHGTDLCLCHGLPCFYSSHLLLLKYFNIANDISRYLIFLKHIILCLGWSSLYWCYWYDNDTVRCYECCFFFVWQMYSWRLSSFVYVIILDLVLSVFKILCLEEISTRLQTCEAHKCPLCEKHENFVNFICKLKCIWNSTQNIRHHKKKLYTYKWKKITGSITLIFKNIKHGNFTNYWLPLYT